MLFFLFPLCVISLQDRKKGDITTTRGRGIKAEIKPTGGKWKSSWISAWFSSCCTLPACCPCPHVSCCTQMSIDAQSRGLAGEGFWFGYRLPSWFHWDQFNPHVTQRSYCKQLCVTLSCSGVQDFEDKTVIITVVQHTLENISQCKHYRLTTRLDKDI